MAPAGSTRRVPGAAAAALLLASACVADGHYRVRGQVLRAGGDRAPIAGASVKVGLEEGRPVARTAEDGRYEADYAFGGLFPFVAGGSPPVEVAAPGYRTRRVDLKGPASGPGVTRAACAPEARGCFVLDVVLDPEGAGR